MIKEPNRIAPAKALAGTPASTPRSQKQPGLPVPYWIQEPIYGFSGGTVFLVSSVFVTVPSGAWVTVFSFDLTVPSLLTLLDFSVEISRSHPTTRNDNANADIATQLTII